MEELSRIKQEKIKELMKGMEDNKMEIEVKDDDFEEKVIKKSEDVPVVVDFWAEWCAPCIMLSPTLEKLSKEYEGKFLLAKCNVDEARTQSTKYSVMSIPNVKMFRDGKIVDEFVGVIPEQAIRKWLYKNLR